MTRVLGARQAGVQHTAAWSDLLGIKREPLTPSLTAIASEHNIALSAGGCALCRLDDAAFCLAPLLSGATQVIHANPQTGAIKSKPKGKVNGSSVP